MRWQNIWEFQGKIKKDLFTANINFNKAVNQVRENLAKEYLSDKNFNMNEISDLLGYAEQSVFQRAFKNWTKKTPLQFRKDILKKS
jgi:AraC-like DNA-binding protein